MENTINLTHDNFETEVEKSQKPVVVDVYATWCGPCQHMAPSYDELAGEYGSSYTFGKLNVDEARDVAIKFNIMSVPTFLFFNKGKLVGTEVGYMSKDELESKIKQHLS